MLGFYPLFFQLQITAQIKSLLPLAWPMAFNSLDSKKILMNFKWKHKWPFKWKSRINMTCGGKEKTLWSQNREHSHPMKERKKDKPGSQSVSQDHVVLLMVWFVPVNKVCLLSTHRNTREYVYMVSRHQVCGNLLQYLQTTNIDAKKVGWHWNRYLNSF